MTIQRACWLTLVAVIAFTSIANQESLGQMYSPQGWGYGAQPPAYPMAAAPGAAYGMPVDYQAMPMVMDNSSAFYEEPVPEDGEVVGDSGECVESRYGYYSPSHRVLGGALSWLLPYSEGTSCTPHWFDVHAEAVYLSLDDNGPFYELSRDTTTQTAISSNDLITNSELGLRITGALQVGAGSNLEFTYLGLFEHSKTSTVYGNDNLNSVFSNFTLDAPPNGLEQFDLADMHQAKFSNDLDSIELNYRRRWVGPSCMLQGSWLVGVRYLTVQELLDFKSIAARDTTVPPNGIDDTGGTGRYVLNANNYMTGVQGGGDLWVSLLPGLRFGMEGKGGIYGNNAKQQTDMWGIDFTDNYVGIIPTEKVKDGIVSFTGELSFMLNYRLNHNWTLRGGYEMLWISNVALASRNFNPSVPGITPGGRTPFVNNHGTVFYNGITLGAEWMW